MADRLEIKPEEQVEDPKHAEEMIAKAEGREPEEQLLAGKYKSEEDLQKGILELIKKDNESLEEYYKSLESKVLSQNQEQQDTGEEETKQTEPVPNEEEVRELEQQMKDSPVDFSEFEQEYFENGEISEESYEKLKEQGFDKQLVDRYIEGVEALVEKQAQEVFNAVGGQDKYEQMLDWAADNLTDKEKQIFNSAVESTDIDQAKFAVEALYGKYMRAEGNKPTPIQGKAPSAPTGQKFNSRAEVVEAMSNPKYETDPAYRAMVEKKLRNSDVF